MTRKKSNKNNILTFLFDLPFDLTRKKKSNKNNILAIDFPFDLTRKKKSNKNNILTIDFPFDLTRKKIFQRIFFKNVLRKENSKKFKNNTLQIIRCKEDFHFFSNHPSHPSHPFQILYCKHDIILTLFNCTLLNITILLL